MRFSRTALIERIDEIEADRKAAHDAAHAPRLAAWEKAVEDYRTKRAPELVKQLRDLAEKARKGVILTSDELGKALGTEYNFKANYRGFEYPRDPDGDRHAGAITQKPVKTAFQPDRQLAALRALLVRTTDDYVSTTALKELGFQPQQFIKAAV